MLNFVLRANLRTQVMSGDFFSVTGNDVDGKFADGGVGAGESTHTPVNLNWREWFYHRLLKIALFFVRFSYKNFIICGTEATVMAKYFSYAT